ncbi:MAG: hypothetical protein U9N83_13675 [Thermodesulfobacteriota bacterium]|nr:hypothetical protein [Thermodesulfobacteriota bacterium]
MHKRFKIDKDFKPCLADDGDEFFANGIFEFNISKMIADVQNNPDVFVPETVVVKRYIPHLPISMKIIWIL